MTVTIDHGTFGYGRRRPILEDLSVEVESGHLLAVLGPNGAGKTTLLRCLLGLLPWRSGHTRLDGVDIADLPAAERWRRFAFVPQARNAVTLSITGLEMVTIGRSAHLGAFAQPGPADLEIAREIMEEIGIEHLAAVPCGEMSGGQYQMVLIARALATRPRVLVLDEPETGLDFRNQIIVLDLVDRLVHASGLTVVMNTHYPTHALRVADEVLLLPPDGPPRWGPAADVVTPATLGEVFGVRVVLAEVAVDGAVHQSVLPISLV